MADSNIRTFMAIPVRGPCGGIYHGGFEEIMDDQAVTKFDTGAVRGSSPKARLDLISPVGLRRVGNACAEGAVKYPPHNWKKGMPASVLINHALEHIASYLEGKTEEDDLGHAIWNLMTLCHFEEKMPHLIDIPERPEYEHYLKAQSTQ
jgi:hypothetical protein